MKALLRIVSLLTIVGVCLALEAAAGASNPTGPAGRAAAAVPERSPSVVGGTVAAAGGWPWMVRLDIKTPDGLLFPTLDGQPDVLQWCGGSLIGERWVLTAGHCALLYGEVIGGPGFVQGISFRVVVGETHLEGIDDPAHAYEIQPDDIIALQPAAGGGLSGDLALIRLPSPAHNQALRIVGSSNDPNVQLHEGELLTATGWGVTSEDSFDPPDDLRQVEVPLVSDANCRFFYPTVGFDFGYTIGFDANTMVCAGTAGKDTCFGDSGGPLMAPDGAGGFVQVGLTSWGEGCAEASFPGVYGRLSGLYGFILSTLKSDREAPAGLAEATTGQPQQVRQTSARLLGMVMPNGLATAYVIEYGTTRRYLGGHIQGYAGAGSEEATVSALVKGLKPGVTYHVRVRALNLAGAVEGTDIIFKTKAKPAPRHR